MTIVPATPEALAAAASAIRAGRLVAMPTETVYGLSADATKGQIARLMETGAAGYLTKPLDIPQFLEQIRQSLTPQPVG